MATTIKFEQTRNTIEFSTLKEGDFFIKSTDEFSKDVFIKTPFISYEDEDGDYCETNCYNLTTNEHTSIILSEKVVPLNATISISFA